jgi:hypothetical protein
LEADLEQFTKLQKFVDIEWHKVRAPRTWRPKPGEQLIGYYYGKSTRLGHHGQYEVVQMAVPGQGMWLVSGTTILQLVNSACLQTGDPMKVVFLGEKALEGDKKLKLFELFVSTPQKDPETPQAPGGVRPLRSPPRS